MLAMDCLYQTNPIRVRAHIAVLLKARLAASARPDLLGPAPQYTCSGFHRTGVYFRALKKNLARKLDTPRYDVLSGVCRPHVIFLASLYPILSSACPNALAPSKSSKS